MILSLKGVIFETGSFGNPAATYQRDYWRVALQLMKCARVDPMMLVLMSAELIPLNIHLKGWLFSTKAVAVLGIATSISSVSGTPKPSAGGGRREHCGERL